MLKVTQISTFSATQTLSLVLNLGSLVSAIRSGGSLLYQWTDDQHQLLLVRSSSHKVTDGFQVTPAAARLAAVAAACLVLYWSDPMLPFGTIKLVSDFSKSCAVDRIRS